MVQTFSSENISFLIYALIGWGCPALCILVWSIAKVFTSHEQENEHFNGVSTLSASFGGAEFESGNNLFMNVA